VGLGDELKIKKASFVNGHELCPCLLFEVTAFSPKSDLFKPVNGQSYFILHYFSVISSKEATAHPHFYLCKI
jgi:hypothetical protein